jgi:hypothetical protein
MSSLSRITMKHVTSVLYNAVLGNRKRVPLGRWGVKGKKEVVDLNIMYSNEDHCGVCNGYVNEVKKEIIKKEELLSNERMLNDEFIWMLGTTGDFVKK